MIPLSYNKIVNNFIKLYSERRRDLVQIMLGLSEYYFPIFEEVLDKHDLPVELKYMAIIESALNPRAVSKAGATGIWQFMYTTGKQYGLEVNSYVDERRNPIEATYSAARFLSNLYDMYGDWILVIAAYNCGPGNVNKAIRRSGGKRDYWEIYYFLPRETRGYVPAFIAASYIMQYHEEYDLYPTPITFPTNVDTLIIKDEVHFLQIAEVLDIPIDQIRDLNPQYKYDIIPKNPKGYPIMLPVEKSLAFIDLQDSILNYNDSVYFHPESPYKKPPKEPYRYVPEPPSGNYEKYVYTIKHGDNLGYIASWYNVGVSQIKYWNGLYKDMIRVGQKLNIYVPKNKAKKYKKIETMSFAEKQKSVGKNVKSDKKEEIAYTNIPDDGFIIYTVKSGDSIWEIAKKYNGVSDVDIIRLNNLKNGDSISPGQKLKIKPKS